MGEIVQFPSNGGTADGYLARPQSGTGPGVLVIQEWWGLVDHIKEVADAVAGDGFVALAPDLYRGATTREPDEAAKLMMALNVDQAVKDLSGAVDLLQRESGQSAIGVVGFCMGGGLALVAAASRPDAVKVCVPFYGVIPWPSARPDYSGLQATVVGHCGELDASFDPAAARQLEADLKAMGKDATFYVYPGCDHAFFNDSRPEVYQPDAAALAWDRTVDALNAGLR